MSDSIHGHDVMRMMVEAGRSYTESQLEEAIVQRFGAEARFHTCSASEMTPKELIGFLKMRSKFIEEDNQLSMAGKNICEHE
ncbi:MAG: YecH family protein [Elusimicrobia bacterium]|nr:YecH family protein [Elusimicrobiota bacterium]